MRVSEKFLDYLLNLMVMQNAEITELSGKYACYAYISKSIGVDKKKIQNIFNVMINFGLVEKKVVNGCYDNKFKMDNIFKFNDFKKIFFYIKTLPRLTKKEFAVLEQIVNNPYDLQKNIASNLNMTENNANVHTCKLRKKGYLTSHNRLQRGLDINIVRFLTNEEKLKEDDRYNK